MTRKTLIFLGFCTLLGAQACTPTIANRGNMVTDEQIDEVITGFHTRSDVLRFMGSPTTIAPFDENVWYYVGQETAKKGILDPKVVNERIVKVEFDESGRVIDVADLDTARADIPVARDKTPTHGNEMTFMQQLLGNMGRFNPATQNSSATDL
jgi:outer membrane protein assembly factor BamE (lipoprotein component of BamABCDE complex)